MTSRGGRLRRSLFQQGVRAVQPLLPDNRELYVCPLCLKGFGPKALEAGFLTIEDVPPRHAGGRPMVLTCRECNNWSGAELDHHSQAMEAIFGFAKGELDGEVPVRVSIGATSVRANLSAVGRDVRVVVVPEANDPLDNAALKRLMGDMVEFGGWDGNEFGVEFEQRFQYRSALISWLRAGYLAAFAALGYRYIGRESLKVVREQIRAPNFDIINFFSSTSVDAPSDERGILLIEDPATLRSVSVRMGRYMVFLPTLDADEHFYARLETEAKTLGRIHAASGKTIPWPNRPKFLLDG